MSARMDLIRQARHVVDCIDTALDRETPLDPQLAQSLLEDGRDRLEDLMREVYLDEIVTGDADVGEAAKPPEFPDFEFGPPKPTADGRFLVVMHDRNVSGFLWMRRYAKKEDALCIIANYTGAERVWLYELGAELDLEAELKEFWKVIWEQEAAA